MQPTDPHVLPVETLRPLLIRYAYHITGSVTDAEDVVQDAYVQWLKADTQTVSNPRSYLIRTVINLAINVKNGQMRQRSAYVGQWLPEPIAVEDADRPVHRKESLSFSLLVLLEQLTAKERAVFILREAFDYEHNEIAGILDMTPANSRKILSRARQQLQPHRLKTPAPAAEGFLNRYLDIIRRGDTEQLEALLREDVTVISDGGGKASASLNAITGREKVTALLLGLYKKFYTDAPIRPAVVNEQPALLYYEGNTLTNCQIFSFQEDRLTHIYFIRNPDKLGALRKFVP